MARESQIDAVITWVDGDDPNHAVKRQNFMPRDSESNLAPTALRETRYQSRFELYYCIRLIRKFAPWINVIHLVTDAQRPDWLSESAADELGVKVVDHTVLFGGLGHHLPTFNSTSIETLLHRIPNITDRFLYFNDDFFLVRPMAEEDWFKSDCSFWRGRIWHRGRWAAKLRRWRDKFAKYRHPILNRAGYIRLLKEKTMLASHSMPLVQLGHAPFPILTEAMRAEVEMNGLHIANTAYRFRSREQFNPITLHASIRLNAHKASLVSDDWYYLNGEEQSRWRLQARLNHCRRNSEIKMLCVQSIDQMNDADQEKVRLYLESLLA